MTTTAIKSTPSSRISLARTALFCFVTASLGGFAFLYARADPIVVGGLRSDLTLVLALVPLAIVVVCRRLGIESDLLGRLRPPTLADVQYGGCSLAVLVVLLYVWLVVSSIVAGTANGWTDGLLLAQATLMLHYAFHFVQVPGKRAIAQVVDHPLRFIGFEACIILALAGMAFDTEFQFASGSVDSETYKTWWWWNVVVIGAWHVGSLVVVAAPQAMRCVCNVGIGLVAIAAGLCVWMEWAP